jgi:hypothetical protein
LKAFLIVDQDDQVVEAFSHDDTLSQVVMCTLRNVANLLDSCHAALVGELTDGK